MLDFRDIVKSVKGIFAPVAVIKDVNDNGYNITHN